MSKRKQNTASAVNTRPGGRRPAPRRSEGIPVLPAAVLLILLGIASVITIMVLTSRGTTTQAVDGITCDSGEHAGTNDVHYHAHLAILYQGNEVTVPKDIGIPADKSCIYWMHTHDDTGVVHVEAPRDKAKDFTLGEFFDIWNHKLSRQRVADFTLTGDQKLVIYIDGKVQPENLDPRSIKIAPHQQIVIEITPPVTDPPPSYTFQKGQ